MIVSYVAAVMPGDEAPDPTGWDKANHMLAFVTMAVLGAFAYPRRPLWQLGAALIAFGGVIELTQMIPALHRDAEWGDWLADTIATVAGLALSRAARASTAAR